MPNRLVNEQSLYLKQHAHNPIDWYPWKKEALDKAKKEDKPIFLSIGYSSCHWCHVMERESFEMVDIADFLNKHFISIKVDREENPDIDHIYMEAVQAMTGQGGWPLNVFLTPDLKPFYGGTYFPPIPKYGRPSFLQIIHRISEIYGEQRDELERKANQLKGAIQHDLTASLAQTDVQSLDFKSILDHFEQQFEIQYGGFSSAPKFPQPMILESLLSIYSQFGFESAIEMCDKTLSEMAKGGIYDQIGGGFHRYSTDKEWLAPHFEKMLYDNAQLLSVYAHGYQATQNPFYQSICNGIVKNLKNDFLVDDHFFGSAWDADSEGEEGKFYIWQTAELEELLTPDEIQLFKSVYEWNQNGNWEGKLILRRLNQIESDEIVDLNNKLLDYRSKRPKPLKDPKIISSWNAMACIGLFDWYLISNDEWSKQIVIQQADYFKDFYTAKLYIERLKNKKGFLDDYAGVGLIQLKAFQISGNEEYLKTAEGLCEYIREHFYDISNDTFFLQEENEFNITKSKEIFDNAVPSSNALCIRFLNELSNLSNDKNVYYIALKAVEKLTTVIQKYPSSTAYHLTNAINLIKGFRQLVLINDFNYSFVSAISTNYASNMLVYFHDQNKNTSVSQFKEMNEVDGKPTAYLCKDFACELPVTTVDNLFLKLK